MDGAHKFINDVLERISVDNRSLLGQVSIGLLSADGMNKLLGRRPDFVGQELKAFAQ